MPPSDKPASGRKRGRPGWWEFVTDQNGEARRATPEELQGLDARLRDKAVDVNERDGITPEALTAWEREERRARLASDAAGQLRASAAAVRDNVKERHERTTQLRELIEARGYQRRPASWIAQRLAPELKRSVNTLRLDIGELRRGVKS